MSPNAEPLNPPEDTWRDGFRELANQGANSLTFGAGGTLLNKIVRPAVEKRRQQFDQDVCDAIEELRRIGRLNSEKLTEHEQFISTYTEAVLAAVRTHDQEKRDALRNAVLNTALAESTDENKEQVFLAWVENLTPLHLRVLRFLQRPPDCPHGTVYGGHQIIDRYPEDIDRRLLDAVVEDLKQRRLTWVGLANDSDTRRRHTSFSTPLGDEFLDYIANPLPNSADTQGDE